MPTNELWRAIRDNVKMIKSVSVYVLSEGDAQNLIKNEDRNTKSYMAQVTSKQVTCDRVELLFDMCVTTMTPNGVKIYNESVPVDILEKCPRHTGQEIVARGRAVGLEVLAFRRSARYGQDNINDNFNPCAEKAARAAQAIP